MLAQAWVTYGAGFNTTMAMLADVAANPGYSLAVHNGERLCVPFQDADVVAHSKDAYAVLGSPA